MMKNASHLPLRDDRPLHDLPPLHLNQTPHEHLQVCFDENLNAPNPRAPRAGNYRGALPATRDSRHGSQRDANPLTQHGNWWPELYRIVCPLRGAESDPRVLAVHRSYAETRADLRRIAASG